MKKSAVLALILGLVFCISGCSAYWDISKMERGIDLSSNTSKAVSASLKEVITQSNAQSLTLILTNNTEQELGYGEEPHLEVQINGEWYVVPIKKEAMIQAIGILLPPNGTSEYKVNLSKYYENLKTGHYRYLKAFSDGMAGVEFDMK
jgi:hypothetical protein